MSIELKSVIHFYLGGEALFDSKRWALKRVGIKIVRLVRNEGNYPRHVQCYPEDCKLLLRRLSDMTYDEFIEAGKIHVECGGRVQITLDDLKDNKVYPAYPAVFAYLLSRSFDLFGLIDSSQAVDINSAKI